jgi:Tol biopolymer transport system component
VPNPDGKRIFFRGRLDKGELVRYQPATNEWRPYLNGLPATQVDYSRDGKWITYVGHRDHCVWRCASDGTNCSQLTSPPVFAVVPFFSPDGSRIIFFDSPTGEGSKSHVYLVPAAGGAVRQLTHGEAGPDGDDGGSWGPDGESLVFSAHGGDHAPNRSDALLPLRVLNVNSGDMKILPGSEGLWSVRWSPDGRYIAAMNSSQTLLFLYDPVTHTKRQITDIAASWPQWSRDSKSIYFGHNGFWYRVSISDRKLERLAPLDKLKMADWTLGWVGVTPDGDLIATADAGSTEIYALDWERR